MAVVTRPSYFPAPITPAERRVPGGQEVVFGLYAFSGYRALRVAFARIAAWLG